MFDHENPNHAPSSELSNHHNWIQNDHLTSYHHDLHHKSQITQQISIKTFFFKVM